MQRSPSDVPPTLAEHYQIRRLCGGGVHADVFEARRGDTRVALKVARRSAAGSGRTRPFAAEAFPPHTALGEDISPNEAVEGEARLLASIEHPAFAAHVESGHSDGCAYLAREWVEAPTWRDLLDSGETIPVRRIRDLTDVLCTLRDSGQLPFHGDIKPDNLFLDGGRVRIIDPSSGARRAEQHELPGLLTTRAYNPLLQCSDIPSLGVLLIEATTGFHPLLPVADSGTRYFLRAGGTFADAGLVVAESLAPILAGISCRVDPEIERIALLCLGLERRPREGAVVEFVEPLPDVFALRDYLARLSP